MRSEKKFFRQVGNKTSELGVLPFESALLTVKALWPAKEFAVEHFVDKGNTGISLDNLILTPGRKKRILAWGHNRHRGLYCEVSDETLNNAVELV